jgi:predicted transcriptional regulator
MKDTTISFKIERSLKAKLSALAREENRSLSNLILKILKEKLAENESKRDRAKDDH